MTRILIILITILFLTGCGHLAPYSEHVNGNIELYKASTANYLRIPYRVIVYDIIPYTYSKSEWIKISKNNPEQYSSSLCPPNTTTRFGKPYDLQGKITIGESAVNIELTYTFIKKNSQKADPYKFNGAWSLVEEINPPPPDESQKFECK